jgi:ribose transport system ATP-binding protein
MSPHADARALPQADAATHVGDHSVRRLELIRVSKTFGVNRALREVSLDIQPGEIHGLVGQNGTGKSTLAKVLTGVYTPDPGGSILVDGITMRLPVRPIEARTRGVSVVHQSLGLVDEYSVVENLRVGRLGASRLTRRIRWKRERARAAEILCTLVPGKDFDLDRPVGSLGEEDRATIAIARALQDTPERGGLVIFDESTRALTRRSLEHFYSILDSVVKTGTSVLLITHRLEEVREAADRVTVLRDGQVVEAGVSTAGLSDGDLARMVVGRVLAGRRSNTPEVAGSLTARAQAGTALTQIRDLTGRIVRDLSFDIRSGEVLGITGLPDAGHEEVPYLLAGAQRAQAGSVKLDEDEIPLPELDPAGSIALKIALVPEGRGVAGLAMDQTVAENAMLLSTAAHGYRLAPLRKQSEAAAVETWANRLDIRPRNPNIAVGKLSGGNQQKVLIAKWFSVQPRLLLLHEPTQAIDVGAREMIVEAVRNAARRGCAVLVSGSDETELAMLCDRVLVLQSGAITAELNEPITSDDIISAIFASPGGRRRLRG